jgi:hypothetical protein
MAMALKKGMKEAAVQKTVCVTWKVFPFSKVSENRLKNWAKFKKI